MNGREIHTPVLLHEVIEYLNLSAGKRFIDATLDGGGHSRAIREQYPDIGILGIELDPVELKEFRERFPEAARSMTLVNDSYVNLERIVQEHQFRPDAILFDLGLSSWHLESSGRGFSFQKDEPLDMRFGSHLAGRTAADIINTATPEELEEIISTYGEERFAPEIVRGIVTARGVKPVMTTQELVEVISRAVPKWYTKRKIHWATKTFQALRIAVNDELENVQKGIEAAMRVLNPSGRLAVISFQGLEDKAVRSAFRRGVEQGLIRWVTKRTIRPSWEERKRNPRSRSAKMKIAEKMSNV